MGQGKTNSAIAGASAGASMGPVGALVGGAAGYMMGADDESNKTYEDLLARIKGIPLPVLKESNPELYKQVVSLNPELETMVAQGPSAMQGISLDPKLRAAQMNALNKFQDIGNAGGRDAQFQSEAAKLQNDINQNLQGNTGAIQQNMATRGMSGGMSEMVQRQLAAQQGANRQSQMGLDLNAQAQQRALAALSSGAQLGGQMSAQDFSQQAAQAAAADRIAQFNTQNTNSMLQNNVGIKNTAQAANANNTQNIANQNTGVRNTAAEANRNLAQQNYENMLSRETGVQRAGGSMAQNQSGQANQQNQFVGNAITAGSKAYGDYQSRQPVQKPQDINSMNLTEEQKRKYGSIA